ncbi:MAG: methyltransferase domain-containing protein [Lachnospiraceae bacterium]|nr:methyltransferase domain-containing protein [Lachnospiraceae bacterium]
MEELGGYKKNVADSFENMSSAYNSYFESGPLRVLTEIVRRSVLEAVKEHHYKILDAGGGDGKLGIMFAQLGHDVTVVDISQRMLDIGITRIKEEEVKGKIQFIQGDLENLDFLPDEEFDFIICEGSVISFLPNPDLGLKEMYRVMKTGGELFICAQNRNFFMWISHSFPIVKKVLKTGRVYPQINAGADYKCSSHSYTMSEFKHVVNEAGFKITRVGSRYMIANRIDDKQGRLNTDPDFFNEVLEMELSLCWNEDFVQQGRILTIIAQK